MHPISTPKAPAAIGPYSQAIVHQGLVWCSGQVALDPSSGQMVQGDVTAQTEQVLKNLSAVLEAAGSGLDLALKVTVFLHDMNDFPAMNAVYAKAFGDWKPARATVQVSRLPKDALVEIDCVALLRGHAAP